MQATSQSKSWKRIIGLEEDEQPSDDIDTQQSRRYDEPSESKRTRIISQDTSRIPDPPAPAPNVTGHSYGPSMVSDNGFLQNGDSYYHAGAASNIFGPGVLNGEMRVHLSNVFHTHNYELQERSSGDPQEKALKSLLYYTTMDDRKAQLSNVEPASFDWIWKETPFVQWLSGPDGVFWISGKPASGKSTLINHLVSDYGATQTVMEHLRHSGRDWLVIKFFFDFRAGTGIANNTLGMLRSLLLQLVEKSTTAKDFVMERCQHRLEGKWPELEAELFELLCGAVKSMSQSICAFVDGLDEYKGSLWKLVDYLLLIQRRSGIKSCLASRPEPELLQKLHGVPKFSMQDHNTATVRVYVEAALADISHFVPVKELQILLKEEVVDQANGVLLWAIFAANEGVKAALHGCTTTEIRDHVKSFPQELSSVYRRIWTRLNHDDQRLAAITFFVIEHWNDGQEEFPITEPLTSQVLALSCRWVVRKLDPSFKIEPGYTELHFRLKMHAMLGGLVEFSQPAGSVRLAHKSVQTFLSQLPEYTLWEHRARQCVDTTVLGPTFFAHAIMEACDAFVPGPIHLPGRWAQMQYKSSRVSTREFDTWAQRRIMKLSKRKNIDMTEDMVICALDGGVNFVSIFGPVQTRLTDMVVMAANGWIMKQYSMLLSIAANGQKFRDLYSQIVLASETSTSFDDPRALVSQLLTQQPQIVALAIESPALALRVAIKDGQTLSTNDCAVLVRLLLIRPERFVGSLKDLLLNKLDWQDRFVLLMSGSLESEEYKTKRDKTKCEKGFYLRPSMFWPYRETHMLYLWVMTSAQWKDMFWKGLDLSLDAGLAVDADICGDGNALHTLFSWDAWHNESRHRREFPRDTSNRKLYDKFHMLTERGANIHINGKCGTVRDAAKQFLDLLKKSIDQPEENGRTSKEIQDDINDVCYILNDIEEILESERTPIDAETSTDAGTHNKQDEISTQMILNALDLL